MSMPSKYKHAPAFPHMPADIAGRGYRNVQAPAKSNVKMLMKVINAPIKKRMKWITKTGKDRFTYCLKKYHIIAEAAKADRKSTRLNSSHVKTSYAVFCLK